MPTFQQSAKRSTGGRAPRRTIQRAPSAQDNASDDVEMSDRQDSPMQVDGEQVALRAEEVSRSDFQG
jgi:hypothetical protein